MPALTLQTSGLCDRILGPTASWACRPGNRRVWTFCGRRFAPLSRWSRGTSFRPPPSQRPCCRWTTCWRLPTPPRPGHGRPGLAKGEHSSALVAREGARDLGRCSEGHVFLVEGDALEVVGVRLAASEQLVATGGVLQLEGYVRMPHRYSLLGEFDYDGGLFSGGMAVGSIGRGTCNRA